MSKIDFKKTLDCYRARRETFRVVEVPPLQYLMIDGRGDPDTAQEYTDAIETVYPVAYALKFASKNTLGRDYVVMPLEGLWWAPDMTYFTTRRDKSRWQWTSMIMVPEWIDQKMFDRAVAVVTAKRRPASIDKIRLGTLREGTCVQTLHVGPYDDEAEVLANMHHRFIPDNGLCMTGKHHEIYLGDARRVEPSKLRTILRQPVMSAGRG